MPSACAHFGSCGGCRWQHLDADAYRSFKKEAVQKVIAQAGIHFPLEKIFITPPRSRRRTVFAAQRAGKTVHLGYYAKATHCVIDVDDCAVITPPLQKLLAPLRARLPAFIKDEPLAIHATDVNGVVELVFKNLRLSRADESMLAAFGVAHNIARIMVDDALILQQGGLTISYGAHQVTLPPAPFLQASAESEAAMLAFIAPHVKGTKKLADLFCGTGLFALNFYEKKRCVVAIDADGRAIEALQKATVNLAGFKTEKRNLFREPLTKLDDFDAVLLDPPRSGALAQIKALAAAPVPKIIYVSCNPASFARDASLLLNKGYQIKDMMLFDQFLWSDHSELVAVFAHGT